MPDRHDLADDWFRFYGGLLLIRRQGVHEASVRRRLLRIGEGLQHHPEAPLDLEAMARAACFSKYHFLRLFREAYGETPGRYRARCRLGRARALLETTDRSVTDICLDVGYESLASFTIAFRRQFGAPPQRYRRHWIAVPRPFVPAARVPRCFAAMYG
ncbi:MAG: transcriptional regulator, AraC family [Acidobacteria bacterium]|nr:transcriptional regulator, AraC family [Acidobacteriota bacterium]